MPFYPFELEEQSLCYSSLCSDLFTRQENPGVSVSKILLGFIWKPGRTLRGLPRYKSPSVIPISCPQNKRLQSPGPSPSSKEQTQAVRDQDNGTTELLKVKVLVTQSCLTLFHPMGCSPPGSSVHGIFQARILKRVAIHFSRGSS